MTARWLARRWFLLLLTGGLTVAVLRPGWVRPLHDALPLRPVVALSLFLMAWSLEGRRLTAAAGRPASVGLALAVSFALVPALALLVAPLLPLADLRLGLVLMACVPCTLSSAVLWTRHAGGDEAVALLVVLTTNALGWLVTPLWLTGAGPVPVTFDPLAMMRSLAVVLVLPVAAGQLVRRVPAVARVVTRHRAANGVAARLLVAWVLIAAAVDAAEQLDRVSAGLAGATLLACVAVHLGGVTAGLIGGRLAGLARGDRIAVAFAGSQKTLPVGLLVFGSYYRADYPLAVLPLLAYHAGQLLVDTLIADALAAGPPPADGGPPCTSRFTSIPS